MTLRKTDQKYLESFEMWYWRNVEIIWTDRVRNEEILQRVKERNILHKKKRRKVNWNVHALRRNCLLKHVIEGTTEVGMEVMVRQGRRRKQLLDVLTETRGYREVKEEAPDRTPWRIRFGRGYGLFVKQTTEWMNEWMNEWMLLSALYNLGVDFVVMTRAPFKLTHTQQISVVYVQYSII